MLWISVIVWQFNNVKCNWYQLVGTQTSWTSASGNCCKTGLWWTKQNWPSPVLLNTINDVHHAFKRIHCHLAPLTKQWYNYFYILPFFYFSTNRYSQKLNDINMNCEFRGELRDMLVHLFWFCAADTKLWKLLRFSADHTYPWFTILWKDVPSAFTECDSNFWSQFYF